MPRTSHFPGPLAAAAESVALPDPLRRAAPRDDRAAFFAKLMDLRGSVAIARCLSTAAEPSLTSIDALAASEAKGLVEERLAAIEASIEATFGAPFQRRNRLPTPEKMGAILDAAGALDTRTSASVGMAMGDIYPPFDELFGRLLGRIRADIASLRDEIEPLLAGAGPNAARLGRLDAAICEAIDKAKTDLTRRLLRDLERSFERGLVAAIAALPSPIAPDDVALWYAPGGFLANEMKRAHGMLSAVAAHERGLLEALAAALSNDPQ